MDARYQYALDSNRLLARPACPWRCRQTATPATGEHYTYDAHGNMTAMPHLPLMQWDFKDQLQRDRAAGGEQRNAGDDLLRLRRGAASACAR